LSSRGGDSCAHACARFSVLAPSRSIHELDTAGLMSVSFMPYHYLRQCLKQLYLAQDRARTAVLADPEAAAHERAGRRMEAESEAEADKETRMIDERVRGQQQAQEAKYDFGRRDEKTSKIRTKERRAGRAFTSVAQTMRDEGRKGSAQRSTPTSTKRGTRPMKRSY
jgi:hypothetical protein